MQNIETLNYSLSNNEKYALKAILCSQIKKYFNSENLLKNEDEIDINSFHQLANMIRLLTKNNHCIPQSGVYYKGPISEISGLSISELLQEAKSSRTTATDQKDHFLGKGGILSNKLSVSESLSSVVSRYAGNIKPTGISSYLYYEEHNSGIKPHVDTEVFEINVIIPIYYQNFSQISKSCTMVFPPFMNPQKYFINIGEFLIMHGSSTVHSRTKLGPDEKITLLTIGYNYK